MRKHNDIPASALTSLKGFRAWVASRDYPERGRVTFLDGEVLIDMSPEELDRVRQEIARVASQTLRGW